MHGKLAAIVLVLLILLVAARSLRAQSKPANVQPHPWYKHAVFYEIYPRSFMDSNGDGIGDLNGIASKLDYLKALGVDAIWIAPCFPSPQVDFGYDVSDYENIDKMYGTLADFDQLQKLGAQHGIKIILDFVVNHTSDQHPWFVDSRSSRTSAKRDWYIWRDGKERWQERRPAEQLDRHIWRLRVAVGQQNEPVLLPLFLPAAAGPELAQSRRC